MNAWSESQTWKYIVKEIFGGQVVHQTDSESNAVRFCIKHPKSSKVVKSGISKAIYANYQGGIVDI